MDSCGINALSWLAFVGMRKVVLNMRADWRFKLESIVRLRIKTFENFLEGFNVASRVHENRVIVVFDDHGWRMRNGVSM